MKTLKESLFDRDISTKDISDGVFVPVKDFMSDINKTIQSIKSKYHLTDSDIELRIVDNTNHDSGYGSIHITFHHYYNSKGIDFDEKIFMIILVNEENIVTYPFEFAAEEKYNPPVGYARTYKRLFIKCKRFYINTSKYNMTYKTSSHYSWRDTPHEFDITYKNKDNVLDYLETLANGFFNQKQFDEIDKHFEKYAQDPVKANVMSGTVLTKLLAKMEK